MPYPANVGDVRLELNDVVLPALLRAARRTYRVAVREAHLRAGFDDMPRNGAFVLGAIARGGSPLSEVIQTLEVSKQATGQLVDTLVARGYLDRSPDPADRRRLTLTLTERGWGATAAARAAVERVNARLIERVGPECFAQARTALFALHELGQSAPRSHTQH